MLVQCDLCRFPPNWLQDQAKMEWGLSFWWMALCICLSCRGGVTALIDYSGCILTINLERIGDGGSVNWGCELTAYVISSSQDTSFKHSLVVVVSLISHVKRGRMSCSMYSCLCDGTPPLDCWRLEENIMDWWNKLKILGSTNQDLGMLLRRWKHGSPCVT